MSASGIRCPLLFALYRASHPGAGPRDRGVDGAGLGPAHELAGVGAHLHLLAGLDVQRHLDLGARRHGAQPIRRRIGGEAGGRNHSLLSGLPLGNIHFLIMDISKAMRVGRP